MPFQIASPSLQIALEPFAQSSFSPFGHVVANPAKHSTGTTAAYTSTDANQGSARKFLGVTDLTNFYELAPSRKPAKPCLNMFSCRPRKPRASTSNPAYTSAYPRAGVKVLFDVKILERHPFTSQTFIPLGRAGADRSTQYLVIVAPTLASSQSKNQDMPNERAPAYPQPETRPRRGLFEIFSRAQPSRFINEVAPPVGQRDWCGLNEPRGPGLPDVRNVRAFIARGDQAVTYGPGTWHAPMVVLGEESIDFVVVQYMNGVESEDVQEVELEGEAGGGIAVVIDRVEIKAKL